MKQLKIRKRRGVSRKKAPGPAYFLNQLAQHHVLLPSREEVLNYARRHRQLAALLPAIAAPVREFFGPAVELSLELYQDPEIDDRYLTMYVRQEKSDSNLIDRIDEVRQRFQERLHKVAGYLLITTDFRKPRGGHGV